MSATMLRARLQRAVEWSWFPEPGLPTGILINADRQGWPRDYYWFAPAAGRPFSWTLTKEGPGGTKEAEYTVALGSAPECDCQGFLRWKSCKHLVAVYEAAEELEAIAMAERDANGAAALQPTAVGAPTSSIAEQVLGQGDLSKLTSEQRAAYLVELSKSLGLNPLSRPFEIQTFNGKTVLYARKDCTEQLRKRDGVTVRIVSRELVGDCYVVHVQAEAPAGKGKRHDEDLGVVPIKGLVAGDLANAIMRAITKAKRRITLSICGLGIPDESEVESMGQPEVAVTATVTTNPQAIAPPAEARPAPLPSAQSPSTERLGKGQLMTIDQLSLECGVAGPQLHQQIQKRYGVAQPDLLSPAQADELIAALARMKAQKDAQQRQPATA